MKILISPAKSLDFESKIPTNDSSEIPFLEQTKMLSQKMASKSKNELKKLAADSKYIQKNKNKENFVL